MMNKIIFLVIYILLVINTFGKDIKYIDLPGGEINRVIKDKKGFIWFATDIGLFRHDTKDMDYYRKDVFDLDSIAFNKIEFIKEIDNKLVLSNEKGELSFFDLANKTFENYMLPNERRVIEVIKKDEENLYILTSTSLFLYNISDNIFYEIYKSEKMKNLFELNNNLIIVQDEKIVKLIDDEIEEVIFQGRVGESFFIEDRIYISQDNLLYSLEKEGLEYIVEGEKKIEKLFKLDYFKIVFSTEDSVQIYDTFQKKLIGKHKKTPEQDLILIEGEEVFWFKSKESVEVIDYREKYYLQVDNKGENEKVFVHNNLYYISKNNKLYTNYRGKESIIKDAHIKNIKYENNTLFFTIDNILYRDFEKFKEFDFVPDDFTVADDKVIVAKGKKIIVYGETNKTFEIDTEINKISFDLWDKDLVWVGSKEKGLIKLNIVNNQTKFIRNVQYDKRFYKIDEIEDFVLLDNQLLAFSPEGNLLIYDYSKELIKSDLEINKFKNSEFIKDKYENIWFSTESKIYRITRGLESVYDFSKELNLQFEGIKNGSVDSEGNIHFAYKNGYITFFPEKILKLNEEKDISFREAFLGEEEKIKDISYAETLYIPHWNKSFTIKFSLLDYFGSGDRNYVYKLKGHRDKWTRLDGKNEISFAFLPSGKYTLEVSYFDINNRLSGAYDEVDIYVEAKPWQSIGAYILYITLALIIGEFIRRYKLKGNKLILHKELQKLSNIFFNIENSKDMTSEFMEKLCLFIGVIDVEICIKEDKQEYITCYKYNLYSNYLEEEVVKDRDKKSIKDKKNDVYFELEKDIINNLSMCRKKEEEKVEFLFELDEKFSGKFIFIDTESRYKKDKFLYKAEMLLRQFIINYKNRTSFEEISRLANYDSLTGVYNRRYFDQMALLNLEQSRRYKHSMTIAIFDIDYFKHINDNYGHHTGDQVLKGIGERIRKNIRETDIFARYGGEEFIICFTETDRDRAMSVCERIRKEIEAEDFIIERKKVGVTTTIGLAELNGIETLDSLIKRADEALYQGKNTGKNKGVIHLKEEEGFADISTLINGQLV